MQITAVKSVLLTSYLLFWGIVVVLTPGVLGNDGCTSGCTSYSGNDDMSSCTSDCTAYGGNTNMSGCKSGCTAYGGNTDMSACKSGCTAHAGNSDMSACTSGCTAYGENTNMSSCQSDCKAYAGNTNMSSCTKNCSCEADCDMSSCEGGSENCEKKDTENWDDKGSPSFGGDGAFYKSCYSFPGNSCESHLKTHIFM
jgi:hypothetical protein